VLPDLTTNQKGAAAEWAIIHLATRLGVEVYRPIFEGGRCDLILAPASKLLRVQCKWAVEREGVVSIRCYSSRRSRDGFLKRAYSAQDVDLIAAYCDSLDACYLLPPGLFDGRSEVSLRIAPTANKQERGIHWASDFDFAAKLGQLTSGP
jgi:hypothetical protein